MSTRHGNTLWQEQQRFKHHKSVAEGLTVELGVSVHCQNGVFRVLGRTADSPEGVRRLVRRLRRTV